MEFIQISNFGMKDLLLYITPGEKYKVVILKEQGDHETGLSHPIYHPGIILFRNSCTRLQCRRAPLH
jgi:hypothetical protein